MCDASRKVSAVRPALMAWNPVKGAGRKIPDTWTTSPGPTWTPQRREKTDKALFVLSNCLGFQLQALSAVQQNVMKGALCAHFPLPNELSRCPHSCFHWQGARGTLAHGMGLTFLVSSPRIWIDMLRGMWPFGTWSASSWIRACIVVHAEESKRSMQRCYDMGPT